MDKGLSSKEIADQIFSSRAIVTKTLKNYGIPFNKVTRRSNGPMVYGYRKYGGKSVILKKEIETVALILEYKKNGYSYQQIADTLNLKKIRTKAGKGIWYSKVVRQIYLRNLNES